MKHNCPHFPQKYPVFPYTPCFTYEQFAAGEPATHPEVRGRGRRKKIKPERTIFCLFSGRICSQSFLLTGVLPCRPETVTERKPLTESVQSSFASAVKAGSNAGKRQGTLFGSDHCSDGQRGRFFSKHTQQAGLLYRYDRIIPGPDATEFFVFQGNQSASTVCMPSSRYSVLAVAWSFTSSPAGVGSGIRQRGGIFPESVREAGYSREGIWLCAVFQSFSFLAPYRTRFLIFGRVRHRR